MILKEVRRVGLPVMGLVNSNCSMEIDYPIFAQNQNLQSIHFFCHFLAALIAKETVYLKHKSYTLQKTLCKPYQTKSLIDERKEVSSIEHKKFFKKLFTLEQAQELQKIKDVRNKKLFFNVVQPQRNNSLQRYFVVQNFTKYRRRFVKKITKKKYYHLKKLKRLGKVQRRYALYKKVLPYRNINNLINQFKKSNQENLKTGVKKQQIKHKTRFFFKNTRYRFHYSFHDPFNYSFKTLRRPLVLYYMLKNFVSYHKLREKFFKRETPVRREEENLFNDEYQKKYFKKKIHTHEESTRVKRKLRNFL
jgi:hypothetical protein